MIWCLNETILKLRCPYEDKLLIKPMLGPSGVSIGHMTVVRSARHELHPKPVATKPSGPMADKRRLYDNSGQWVVLVHEL